jgi:isocitrate dehydrogenase
MTLSAKATSSISQPNSGSVGLAGGANIGVHVAMFEGICGSAPDIAGPATHKPVGSQ